MTEWKNCEGKDGKRDPSIACGGCYIELSCPISEWNEKNIMYHCYKHGFVSKRDHDTGGCCDKLQRIANRLEDALF